MFLSGKTCKRLKIIFLWVANLLDLEAERAELASGEVSVQVDHLVLRQSGEDVVSNLGAAEKLG